MNDSGHKPGRRARLNESASQHLERLRANKAALDLNKQEREQREDTALTRFAQACSRAEQLVRERDLKLAELDRQAEQLRTGCQSELERSQADQVAALNELRAVGRTAEEIAALLELPRDRVRRLLRTPRQSARRNTTSSGNGSAADRPGIPMARLADEPAATPNNVLTGELGRD